MFYEVTNYDKDTCSGRVINNDNVATLNDCSCNLCDWLVIYRILEKDVIGF